MSTHRLSGRLPSHRKFARPITVTVERNATGNYKVREDATTNYGYGPTKGKAIAEYKRMLMADFLFLSREQHHLSEPLQRELEWMRQVITWR